MSDILTDTEAGVMTITFNRVDKKNSITPAMYAAMADALVQATDDAGRDPRRGVPGRHDHLSAPATTLPTF